MTEQPNPEVLGDLTPDDAQDDGNVVADLPQSEDTPEEPKGREARYRTRLRAAEAERDQLAARLTELQTSEIRRLAADLADPQDLFVVTCTTVLDYLDDNGNVDPAAVTEAVTDLLRTRPGLSARDTPIDPLQGTGNVTAPAKPSWNDLLRV